MARSERPHPCGRFPQDPTVCLSNPSPVPVMFHHPPEDGQVLTRTVMDELFVNVPPLSNHPPTRSASAMASAQPAPGAPAVSDAP
jgi:hypothetical protein